VLRRAMADMLPASVLDRKDKLGFSTPESDWLRGGLRHTVETGIALACDRFPALLDWQAGEKLVELAMKDGAIADPQIWRLANLGHWAERFDVT
jgi:asparagine synthase (glutamine-hydrolysing)